LVEPTRVFGPRFGAMLTTQEREALMQAQAQEQPEAKRQIAF
jgi:hypothetical protein